MWKVPAALLTFLAAQQSAAHAKPNLPLLSSARRMQQQDEYEWKLLNENNHGRYDHSAAFDDTERKMYIFGGYRRTRYSRTSLRDLRVWDAQADEWTTLASAGRYTRYGHTAVFDSTTKEMYVHGGYHSHPTDTWKYSVTANTWTPMSTSSPRPYRGHSHAAAFDGARRLMYVLGGYKSRYDAMKLWVLDVQAARWSYLSYTSYCYRAQHTAVIDSNAQKIYVYGGTWYGRDYPFVEFDVQARVWTRLPSSPGRRYGHTAVFDSTKKEMYIHGGYYSRHFSDTWKYSVTANRWTRLVDAGSHLALADSSMVLDAAASKLYLYGGRSSTGYSVDKLWELEFQWTTTSTTETATTTTATTTTSTTTTTTTCEKTGRGPPSPEELQGEGRGPPSLEEWMCLPHEGEPPRGPGNNNGNGNDEPPSGSGNNNGNGNGNDGGN